MLPFTLEVRVSNRQAIAMYERLRLPLGRRPSPLLPRQRRGRADHVAGLRSLLLAIETSCDDTCAAVLDGPRILSNVISSQAAAHAGFGGVVPEVASRHHLELAAPVVEAALAEAGVTARRGRGGRGRPPGPGLIGALLVGVSTAKAIAAARRLPLIPVDHLQGHVAANFLEPEPLEPPFLCLIASGGHTLLAAVRDHERLRDARPDPRRRRRRGLRQVRAPARPRLPGRAGARKGGGRRATPRPSRCRSRWPATPASTSASAA